MKADKVTVTIKMESLSIDTLRGKLAMQDGDVIEWETKRARVEF